MTGRSWGLRAAPFAGEKARPDPGYLLDPLLGEAIRSRDRCDAMLSSQGENAVRRLSDTLCD